MSDDRKNLDKPETSPAPILTRDPWFIWLLVFVFGLYYVNYSAQPERYSDLDYSAFVLQVQADNVEKVTLQGHHLMGRLRDRSQPDASFKTVLPSFVDSNLLQLLQRHDVTVEAKSEASPLWLNVALGFIPWLLMIGLLVYASRVMQSRLKGGIPGFSKSNARRFQVTASVGPTYNDVAGLESAKQDLGEIIDYLKNPEKFQRLGAKMPRGILMMGAPGTGKTLLAKATAAEAGVSFFSISGSEFIELYVGVGASRVRDMFATARREAPALIFIDEIDSVGRARGTGLGGGNDEREQTLNQILAEMDGFDTQAVVVVLAATNRPDVLDPALLRPGRFDRKVILDLPGRQARKDIFRVHTRKTPLHEAVDLEELAALTVGFSGAEIENLVNEAALRAARKNHGNLRLEDFLKARDKVLMGAERRDLLNPDERERIAYHESGHAITAYFSEHADPLQKVSIVPRGRALGMTEQLALEDRHNLDEAFLADRLCILLGGRCAEKIFYGSLSTGAADDLKAATKLARKMVVNWGMSEQLGPLGFNEGEDHPFLGRELTEARAYSEATAQLIDQEIKDLLKEAEARCHRLLSQHRNSLDRLVESLLQQESLELVQIRQILEGDTVVE